jgi:hypothetical protein
MDSLRNAVLLPDEKGQLVQPAFSRRDFWAEVKERLPEVADRIEPWADHVHIVMAELAEAARQAIPKQDRDFLGRLLALLDETVEKPGADPEIENAVAISFLTMDDLMLPHGNEVWRVLSAKMRWLIQGRH